MIRRHLLFLFLLPLTLTIATAEEWCGVVRDAETGEGISTVQILLLRGETKVIRQTISREDGTFCLDLPDSKSDLTVRAALIGYRMEVVRLDTLLMREGKEILLPAELLRANLHPLTPETHLIDVYVPESHT